MNRYQWMDAARAALVNAGLSVSAAEAAMESAGLNPRDAEDTAAPTEGDWEEAFQAGGMRL